MRKFFLKTAWLFLLLALTLMILPVNVYGSNVTNATYVLKLRITNNGTSSAYNVSVPVTLNSTHFVNNDYVWSNMTNSALIIDTGANGYYNPAVLTNTTWMLFVPSIPASSVIDYSLYIGGNSPMSGNLSYFPGTGGMTTADNASLELGNNFSITQTGFFDTSNTTVGHNLINKPGCLVANITIGGNITANVAMNKSQTTLAGAALYLYSGNNEGFGQLFTSFPYGIVTGAQFRLSKDGSPTGTAYARVRKSDGTLIGTIGSLAVSGLTTSPVWVDFNTTSVAINSTTGSDIILSVEYAAGDVNNFLVVDYKSSDVLPNENATVYDGASWTNHSTWDIGYILGETVSVTATGIPSGGRSLSLSLSSGVLSLAGSSVGVANYTAVDSANAWVFCQNSTLPYLESQVISVNGTQRQSVGWQNAAIFIDQSGNGNHATPTFRTTTTNVNVSAILLDMDAVNQSYAQNWTITSYSSKAAGIMPGTPPEMFDELAPVFPGASAINEIEAAAGVPVSLFWFIFPLVIILVIGIVVLKFTQSVFIQVIVMGICVLFVSLAHIWPMWLLVPYAMMGGACALADKVYGY